MARRAIRTTRARIRTSETRTGIPEHEVRRTKETWIYILVFALAIILISFGWWSLVGRTITEPTAITTTQPAIQPVEIPSETAFSGGDEGEPTRTIPAPVKEIITRASATKDEQIEIENVVTKVLNDEILDTQEINPKTKIDITPDKIIVNNKVAVPNKQSEIIANIGDVDGGKKLVTIETNKQNKEVIINDAGLISYSTEKITILGNRMYIGTQPIQKGPSAVVRDLAIAVDKIELTTVEGIPTPTYSIKGITYKPFLGIPIPYETTIWVEATTGKKLYESNKIGVMSFHTGGTGEPIKEIKY
ncbi:MAG: hypothetical protein KJ767_02895 [Nanoarchaeota archaeon]|nr:hypothetical protein [Nanoarchaeota archaeon]